MNETNKMSPKNLLNKYLTPSSKKSRNTLFLSTNNFLNKENNLIISRDLSKKNKTIKIPTNRIFKKINRNITTKSRKENKSAKIYLRLERKEEIEKIIKEEEKKRFFNQEFHLNKNINREELKRRIGNKIPFNKISNKIIKNRMSIKSNAEKIMSTSLSNKKYNFRKSRNIEPKIFLNFKSQDDNDIENSKKNYDMVNDFLNKMDEEKILKFNEMEKNL